jgi:hypothetical protein
MYSVWTAYFIGLITSLLSCLAVVATYLHTNTLANPIWIFVFLLTAVSMIAVGVIAKDWEIN